MLIINMERSQKMAMVFKKSNRVYVTYDGKIFHRAINCPECFGLGEVELNTFKPQSFSRDVGYIETNMESCEHCEGLGVIEIDGDDDE
jgi:excinuclease UvrABC ATPase subunit